MASKPDVDDKTSVLKFRDVYESLAQDVAYYWYDIFSHLGFSHETLQAIYQKYPFESACSLRDIVRLWLAREDPPPRWEDLVWVLRYKILEGKTADQIEKTFIPDPERELKEKLAREREKEKEKKSQREFSIPPPQKIENNNVEFSKFIMRITEKLGSDTYAELHHCMEHYRAPNGTPVCDPDEFNDYKSIDCILIPLICTNTCSCRDLDLLKYILDILGREDQHPRMQEYLPKVDMGNEGPYKISEPLFFIGIHVSLGTSETMDILGVSAIKRSLCECFQIEESPHLMQFIGWEGDPVTLTFQVPVGCTGTVQEGILVRSEILRSHGIVRAVVEANGTKFTYDLNDHSNS